MKGSPPRLRGAGPYEYFRRDGHRITPAPAGSRTYSSGLRTICRDHPRACGEQAQVAFQLYIAVGSPPRLRGAGSRRGGR